MAVMLQPFAEHAHSRLRRREAGVTTPAWWQELIWVGAAAAMTFAVTAVFSGMLELSRGWLVLLAALVPVGVSLLALGMRARRPAADSYEAWWQARAAARANGIALPSPPPDRYPWFV